MKRVLSEGGNSILRPALSESVPSGRGGTLMHPAAEQARQSLGNELMAVLSDQRGSDALIAARWDDSTKSLSRSPLASAIQEQVKSGAVLPSECKEILQNESAFVTRLLSGTYQGVQTSEVIGAAAIMQTLATGMEEQLPTALQKYAPNLPPIEADLVVFAAALTSIGNRPPNMSNPQPWQVLAAAANPMYRLLALRAARQGEWADNGINGRLAFASYYENETDPTINLELVQMLGTVPSAQARTRLEALKQRAANVKDNLLLMEIEQALQSNDLLTSSGTATR